MIGTLHASLYALLSCCLQIGKSGELKKARTAIPIIAKHFVALALRMA